MSKVIQGQTNIRVYYRDTDMGGVVYYAKYLEYFEIGRTELLRELGWSAERLHRDFELISPVVNASISYKKSAVYDDNLNIITKIVKKTPVRLYFEYEIFNDKGDLLCTGETLNCGVHTSSLKPKKFPADFLA